MAVFRLFLVVAFVAVCAFTVSAVQGGGFNFVTPFSEAVVTGDWQGQFNVDFLGYLLISAWWVAWRHRFSAAGLALAAVASTAGMLFFAPYLLWQSVRANGDARALLLGVRR